MISKNTNKYKNEEILLESKLNELKSAIPNWLWNALIKLISFGKINLQDIKQKQIRKLFREIEEFSKIYKKINNLENKLNTFQNNITDIYINAYKKNMLQNELESILKPHSFYDLSIENEKYPFLSKILSNDEAVIKEKNHSFILKEKKNQAAFFKTVEANPLTESQQNAVVINEDNNLVIAGAGSGKTSVIVAKIGYLIKRGFAKPEEILVLAFNKKAVEEIKERIAEKLNLVTNVSTFHSYGLSIIGKANRKPIICNWATDDKELTNSTFAHRFQ